MQVIEFADGDRMPALGLGTWKSKPGEVGAAVREALRIGYRHLDCAAIYGNEAEVGAALAASFDEGEVSRDELWVTSKLWNNRHAAADVQPALEQTLADLRLDHLDLYLIHWPVALRRDVVSPSGPADFLPLAELPLSETWRAMEDLREAGLARHVGVSNFSVAKLAALHETARTPPEMNQVELHPYLQQTELVEWCQAHGTGVTAYSPLGSRDRPASLKAANEPDLLVDATIASIAGQYGATPAQVLLAWALARGTAVIPKSVDPGRLAQNLAAAQLELSDEDLERIAELDRARRYVTGAFWAVEGGPYTLANLWDEPTAARG